jgi:hypothetical protein
MKNEAAGAIWQPFFNVFGIIFQGGPVGGAGGRHN